MSAASTGGARAGVAEVADGFGIPGMAQLSSRSSGTSTTDLRTLVASGARAIKDTIFAARSRATATQHNEYVRQLAKDLAPNRERTKCVEQVVALVIDIADRGNLEDAEEIGRQLITIAREAHRTRHDHSLRCVKGRSIREIHLAETRAEGEVRDAEIALLYEPTLANEERYLVKSSRASRWRRSFDNAVRRMAVLGGCPS